MRSDILFDKKGVHIALKKDIHLALREKLMKYNLTMNDFFQDAVDFILNDGPKADAILQKIVKKKIIASLEKRNKNKGVGALDAEALYKLLEESTEGK